LLLPSPVQEIFVGEMGVESGGGAGMGEASGMLTSGPDCSCHRPYRIRAEIEVY